MNSIQTDEILDINEKNLNVVNPVHETLIKSGFWNKLTWFHLGTNLFSKKNMPKFEACDGQEVDQVFI